MSAIKKLLILAALIFCAQVVATPPPPPPANGETFGFYQPDGTLVLVRAWGDQEHADIECLEGYTLTLDEDGWLSYAQLSDDGDRYLPTGARYTGEAGTAPPHLTKGLRISAEGAKEKRETGDGSLLADLVPEDELKSLEQYAALVKTKLMEPRKIVGLVILIDFPDDTARFSRERIEEHFNKKDGNSLYDYYLKTSGGRLEFTNIVTPYIRAPRNKAYYGEKQKDYKRAQELIQYALRELDKMKFDLSGVTLRETTGDIEAVTVYYAGRTMPSKKIDDGKGGRKGAGLWPHASSINRTEVSGQVVRGYQLSSIGNSLSTGLLAHELGHHVFNWPDIYESNVNVTEVTAGYCQMNGGPAPNPHFSRLAGWTDVTDITKMRDTTLTITANSNTAYRYRRNTRESYYIEARANRRHQGLVVWHIHKDGRNPSLDTLHPYPRVKVVQADNPASTQMSFPRPEVRPSANATFRADGGSGNTAFNMLSSPAARWHDSTLSLINITNISAAGDTMTFTLGGQLTPPAGTFTVTFDTQDGVSEVPFAPYVGVVKGRTINAPPDKPIKAGFDFEGWCKDQRCRSLWDFGKDKVNGDMTLYAKWKSNGMHVGDIDWYLSNMGDTSYTIGTAEELAGLAYLVNSKTRDFAATVRGERRVTIRLANDIDLRRGYGRRGRRNKGWVPIGISGDAPFRGLFEGNGNTIRGVYIDDKDADNKSNLGLFGHVDNGAIRNVGVVGVEITGAGNTGGLAGQITGTSASVFNSYTTGKIRGAGSNVGGLVGIASGGSRIMNSYSIVKIDGEASNAGGLAGRVSGGSTTISNSYAAGEVRAKYRAGGLVGHIYSSRKDSRGNAVLRNSAALNPGVSKISEAKKNVGAGRVVGQVGDAVTLSDNIAFCGMPDTFSTGAVWASGRNGANISPNDIRRDPSMGGRFSQEVWTLRSGRLPGLFGETEQKPLHLRRAITCANVAGSGPPPVFARPEFEISAGLATVEGNTWGRLALGMDIPLWRFGLGLDIELFINDDGFDDKSWDFGDNASDAFFRKVRYLRYGRESDPLYVNFGMLESVTLGHGIVMDRFTNVLNYPEDKLLGLQFHLKDFTAVGITLEGMVSDFAEYGDDGGIIAARAAFKPLYKKEIPLIKNLTVGATYAVDRNVFARLDSVAVAAENGEATENIEVGISDYKVWGIDAELPLVNLQVGKVKLLDLSLYAQFAKNAASGGGYALGLPGIAATIWKLDANVEYRVTGGRFTPGFFDAYYLNERFAFDAQREEFLSKGEMLDNETQSGFYGRAKMDVLSLLDVEARVQYMLGKEDDNHAFEAKVGLGGIPLYGIPYLNMAEFVIRNSFIGHSRNIKFDSNGNAAYDFEPAGIFDRTPFLNWGYRLGFDITANLSILWDYRYSWTVGADGILTSDNRMFLQSSWKF